MRYAGIPASRSPHDQLSPLRKQGPSYHQLEPLSRPPPPLRGRQVQLGATRLAELGGGTRARSPWRSRKRLPPPQPSPQGGGWPRDRVPKSNHIVWVDGLTTRTLRSTDRSSRPVPTARPHPSDAKPRTFTVICRSSMVHQNRNPFRRLSEMCGKLSPRSQPSVESLHRRTKCEIMTSDWCSEAGWFGCRSGSGQAGKVWQA